MCLSLSCSGISVWFCKCHQCLIKQKEACDSVVVLLSSRGKTWCMEDVVHEDITSFSKSAGAWHLRSAWKRIFNAIREKGFFLLHYFYKCEFYTVGKTSCWFHYTLHVAREEAWDRAEEGKCSHPRASRKSDLGVLWGGHLPAGKNSPVSLCFTQSTVANFPLTLGLTYRLQRINPKSLCAWSDTNPCCMCCCKRYIVSIVQLGEHSCNCPSTAREAAVSSCWMPEAFFLSISKSDPGFHFLMTEEAEKELPLLLCPSHSISTWSFMLF